MTSSIRTIFWDIGGVLLTNGWGHEQRDPVLKRLGIDKEAYEEQHERANHYWERGLIDAEEFFRQTVFLPNPKLNVTFEILWSQVCARSKVLHPECLDILAELKTTGKYRIATLNNESRELNDHRLDAFKLRCLFDYFICSGYVHEMKPNPGIYRSAIDISGFPPGSALLIDDKLENCEAAEAFGMNTIHFKSPEQLAGALSGFGIQVQELALS